MADTEDAELIVLTLPDAVSAWSACIAAQHRYHVHGTEALASVVDA